MKPVLQTKFKEDGNCLCACLASLLEIPIESIPNPKHNDWQDEMNRWLIENHGLYIMSAALNPDSNYLPSAFVNNYTIGVGESCNNLLHAVICRDKRIVHDPLPNSGLTYDKINSFDLLVKFFE